MSQHESEEHPQHQQQQQQADITSLQQNFSKQQEKISALKELVRKSEVAHGKSTSSTQEKVKNIALRLTNLKSKARSRQNLDSSTTSLNESQFQSQENLHLLQSQCSTTTDAGGGEAFTETPHRPLSARIETPGSEKILLLRKQMEENKVKMAEREHSKREIEHMVTQLKAKFDTTQQCLEHSSELGRSMGDLSALSYSSVGSKVRSATDLASAPFNLDKERIKFLDNRVRLLEKQLEKQKSSSDASKRVIELENKILELEEGLMEKRTRELVATLNDHEVEESWQIENQRLKTELEEKSKRIVHLEEVNDILETAKCDLTDKSQELEAKLQESEKKSKELEEELEKLKSSVDSQKFDLISDAELDRHVEQELVKQVQQLETRIKELEQENDNLRQENENLQDENREEGEDKTDSLEATIESQREDIMNHIERVKTLEEELMEKTIELNVLNANYAVLEEKLKVPSRKPLFATMSDGEVSSLKDELEETKKKTKHLEKQLNEFKRMSDMHATVAELTDENEELQQKITELEDEKGQLLLKMESGEHTTIVTEIEIEKKIEYLEATCQNQTSAIQLLEEQKMDMTEDLESTKSELECARVVSEMESIQLEEQVNTNLQKIEELQRENVDLIKTVEELREEKSSLTKKMEHYVAENMELLDKVEKLSKSSSSAESIEIVERLTQQDRLEIEAFNKRVEREEARLMTEEAANSQLQQQQPMDPELSDCLVKLKEESSELMHKIELFTTERKEVLEKMEALTAENQEHLKKIDQLSDEKLLLERSNQEAHFEREALKRKFDDANEEKQAIRREIREMSAEKTKITAEMNSMIKAASLSVPSDSKDLLDKCEKSLAKLNVELESYRKANDKNAKFNVSKKLSKEAKNTHQQLTELLVKVKGAAAEPVVSPVDDAKIEELQSVIADLREELTNTTTASEEKDTQISRLNEELTSLRSMSEEFDKLINDKEMAHEKQIESLTRLRRELEAKIETSQAEMKILQDLIAEQKQQLIEAYTDSENEVSKKMEELNDRDEEISKLKAELKALQENSGQVGQQFSNDLQLEVDKLREALSINKGLLAEQIDDLTNKQETIDTLNAQIMELYKTMEENAEKVIEKEDEIALVQEQLDVNKTKIAELTKENEENKQVVDKLLFELQSQKSQLLKLTQLPLLEQENSKLSEENQTLEENLQIAEMRTSQLEKTVQDLEHKNKEQLDKLKKYAANLKKKVTQCQEFEAKIKNLEKGALDAEAQEKNPLIETLKEELLEKTSQLELKSQELQTMQEASNQQKKYLEESVQKVQEALDGVQHEMMTLREKLYEKTRQVEELQLALNERNSELQSQLSVLQEQLKENIGGLQQQILQDEIRNLQNQLNEKNANIDELNDQIEESEPIQAAEELRNLHNLVNEKNAKIDELNDIILEAEPYHEELHVLRQQLNEKNAEINQLNEQNRALGNTSKYLQEQLDVLQEQFKKHTDEFDMGSSNNASLQSEMRNLQILLNEKNAKIDELNNQIREAQPFQIQQAQPFQDGELREELRNLHNLVSEKNAKIDELNDIILEAEPYHEELPVLREQLKERDMAIEELKAQILMSNEQDREQIRTLHNLVNEKNAKIDELNDIILEAEPYHEELPVLREQLREKNTAFEELKAQMLMSNEHDREQIRTLHNLMNEKNAKIDELNDIILEAEPYHEELPVLREQLREKNTAIEELKAQLMMTSEHNNTNNPLLTELTMIREKLNAKDKEIEKQNKILDSTEEQLSLLQEEIDSKNNQIRQLNEQLQSIPPVSSGQSLVEEIKLKDAKIEELTKEFKAKSIKFEKSKAVIKEKNREIQRLNQLLCKEVEEGSIAPTSAAAVLSSQPPPVPPSDNNSVVQAEVMELRKENTKIRDEAAAERASFQETIARLETVHDGIQAKLQEDMSYIETLEQENNNFKEKICRLEECVAMFEDRRASMERRANLLDAQLQTRTDEHAKVEDELVYRLNMLSDHDDIIGQRLFEAQEENELLSNRLEALKTEHSALVANYAKLEKEYAGFQEHTKTNLEAENQMLKTQIATIDTEMKRIRGVYEAQIIAKNSEIDELENDLSEQLRVINDEKRLLSEELEKSKDEISELKDERVRLNETMNSLEQAKADLERESTWIKLQNENLSQDQFELQELRMQSMQDKTELENLKHQIDTLAQNHDIELNALRTQIAELDSMRMQVGQNQTDDQVFIETENKRLTDLLAEKESLIENYQRQNLQLQMNALAARQQPVDPFASLTQSDDSAQMANLREKCDRLERELNEKQREIDQMRMEQQQVVVPPPLAFFGADQAMPSVFDEIVSARHVDSLHGAASSRSMVAPSFAAEEPAADNQQTIENLQRNVSDLEKHAQDLENKLSHRITAHEDSLRQLEELKRTFEIRMREYEERIKDLELQAQDTKNIDCQIIPSEQVPTLDMFFGGTPEQSPFETIIIPQVSAEPVVEEMIVPKKAYDCQPGDQLELLDEGWGWGSEEAALEAKHFAATSTNTNASSLIPPQQQLEFKLQDSHDRIQELELERDRLVQQKQEMQVKSGKLMKKLKEYKSKIDELYSQAAFRKSSSVESSDLDLAIQEEMKSQLKQLEEKLAEAKKMTDTQSLEKENLLKRIDVLTAGNERLSEMKERQDNDVAMYKSRVRELTEKIKSLEDWSAAAAPTEAAPTTAEALTTIPAAPTHELEKSKELLEKKVEELLSEIDDISGDRMELQALLDEEKANVQRAEQAVKTLNEKITRLENSAGSDSADQKFHLNEIKLENQNLKSQLTDAQEAITKEKKERLAEINELAKQSEKLCGEIAQLQSESVKAKELEAKLEQVSAEKHNLIKEIEALRMELTFTPKPSDAADELQQQIVRLTCDFESIVMQNQDLGREVDRLKAEGAKLNETNHQLLQEINSQKLQQSFNVESDDKSIELASEVNRLQLELQSLKQRNEELTTKINQLQFESTFNVGASGGFIESEQLSSEINRLTFDLQTVNARNEELSKEVAQLRLELAEKETLQKEVTRLTYENQSLSSQIGRFKAESSSSPQLTELEEQIQEKESEIMHLKQRIEDLMREDQTEKLVLEILTKNQEIHMLKMQVKNLEDDKQELEHNLTMQITQEINTKRVDEAEEKIQQLQQELENMRIEKAHMEEELQVLNNHVMSSLENEEKMKNAVLELDTKNIEIAELRKSLSAARTTHEPSSLSSASGSNAQWEAVIEQRCSEIAEMWRVHLDNREKEFKETESKLQREIEAVKAGRASPLQQSIADADASSKETSPDPDLIQKMQQALENQEVEIVTLKEQLAIRSAEYARLAAQFDPYKMQSTMSHSSGFSSDGQRPTPPTPTGSQVPKTELDLALYMLHQRDMRCEELTLELVHLLEERDTLQLKLSNTLRQVEAIKSQTGSEPSQGELSSPTESPEKPQLPAAPAVAPTPSESDELHHKLSQLHSVSHSKRFQEERDMRQRQMEQIQQDVAKMPSEALSQLVGSDLSQSTQSPSSVLLNWLWGKPSGGQS